MFLNPSLPRPPTPSTVTFNKNASAGKEGAAPTAECALCMGTRSYRAGEERGQRSGASSTLRRLWNEPDLTCVCGGRGGGSEECGEFCIEEASCFQVNFRIFLEEKQQQHVFAFGA